MSYAAWFNAKRGRVGHVFQGRFNSVLIDHDGAWLLLASEYLHLNPVRTKAMGLGKREAVAARRGYAEPSDEEVAKRVEKLRTFPWSSYPAYAGYARKPKWLRTETILGRAGGRDRHRESVQEHLTEGADPKAFESLRGRVALGSTRFVEQAKRLVNSVTQEHAERRFVEQFEKFERIVEVVEQESGELWADIRARRGSRLRNLVFYLARQRSGLTLQEVGTRTDFDYKLVGKAAGNHSPLIRKDKALRALTDRCMAALAKSEM